MKGKLGLSPVGKTRRHRITSLRAGFLRENHDLTKNNPSVLQARKSIELHAWLFTERVATLSVIKGRMNFCYCANWLARCVVVVVVVVVVIVVVMVVAAAIRTV